MIFKSTFTLLSLLFVLSFSYSSKLYADHGGPDKFGYTWKDSNDPGGPVYQWYEIPSNTDEVVNALGDDNVMGPFPMGGNFIFYWYPVNQFWVSANGYISFDNINIAFPFPNNLPDSLTQKYNFIAPFMVDLTCLGAGNESKCLYHITPDSLIVSFINFPFWSAYSQTSYTGLNTFQVILNRVDNSITFNYQQQQGVSEDAGLDYPTIGIENLTGTLGLQYNPNVYPPTNYSIKFYYPQNTTYKITDGGINYNTTPGSKGFFLPFPYNNFSLVTDIHNYGNQNINSYTISGNLTDPLGTVTSLPTLNFNKTLIPNDDTLIKFSKSFTPQITGTYSFKSKISNVINDRFTSDDSIIQEIIPIDTSQIEMNLTYAKGLQPQGDLDWTGGNGGAAVYFVPPINVYPVKLLSSTFIIYSNPNLESFYAKIYDDKGPDGRPGNLLDSVLVTADKIEVGHKIEVPVSKDIIIYSGGIYVAWIMNGLYITLGEDLTAPFSYQTFENVSGIFAQFRQSNSTDFFIGLNIAKHGTEDLGVSSFKTPGKDAIITKPATVSCWVKNYGQSYVSNFSVYYSMDYGNQIIEPYTGDSLKPGDSLLFTFKTPLYTKLDSVVGNLCAGTIMANDYNPKNDSTCNYVKIYKTSGVENISLNSEQLTIIPNPFSESTIIKFTNQGNAEFTLTLYDVMGKELRKINNITSNNISLNRDNLAAGIYYIDLQSTNTIFTAKLIISN